jgi:RNA polymerase sigma-32 factor
MSATVPAGADAYIRAIWKMPLLSASEEERLARQVRLDNDRNAAEALVTSHLRLVVQAASRFRGYGFPLADLISEGTLGLMMAVSRFDPSKGFRLSTYALWWIRAAIIAYVLKNWSMVQLGPAAAQKRLFFSLKRAKEKLGIKAEGELTATDAKRLSELFGVTDQAIRQMDRRLAARDVSLHAPVRDDSNETFESMLADDRPDPEAVAAEREERTLRSRAILRAVAELPERERRIFAARHMTAMPQTLEVIGADLGISRERVRQLDNRAFHHVQQAALASMQPGPASFALN